MIFVARTVSRARWFIREYYPDLNPHRCIIVTPRTQNARGRSLTPQEIVFVDNPWNLDYDLTQSLLPCVREWYG